MKQLIKPLLFMLFSLFATACQDQEVEPTISSFKYWKQTGNGQNWYYDNPGLSTFGNDRSKVISNTDQNRPAYYSVNIEVDNTSLEAATLNVLSTSANEIDYLQSIQLLPGKVNYSFYIHVTESGYIGFEVVGQTFNVRVLNFDCQRSRQRPTSEYPPRPRR